MPFSCQDHDPHTADDMAKRFIRRVCASWRTGGHPVRSRHLVEILHRNRRKSLLSEFGVTIRCLSMLTESLNIFGRGVSC